MKKSVVLFVLLTLMATLPAYAQREFTLPAPGINTGVAAVAFDPQPEPPGTIRGFNPQPDPPRLVNGRPTTGYEAVGFNPQPDPPHEALLNR